VTYFKKIGEMLLPELASDLDECCRLSEQLKSPYKQTRITKEFELTPELLCLVALPLVSYTSLGVC